MAIDLKMLREQIIKEPMSADVSAPITPSKTAVDTARETSKKTADVVEKKPPANDIAQKSILPPQYENWSEYRDSPEFKNFMDLWKTYLQR